MSAAPGDSTIWGRLPEWARPRDSERRTPADNVRRVETTVLVLFALLLALATFNDVHRQIGINHRLVADMRTWRAVTGHDYHNLGVEQDVKGYSTRDIVCANTSPGAPGERTQLCLTLEGQIIGGYREVTGGFYLPPELIDKRFNRYGCFGAAAHRHLCGLTSPPAGALKPTPVRLGRP